MNYVIVECGSSARGDMNVHSDIDVVCLWGGEIPPDFDQIKTQHGDVMFYSMDTIERMKRKGSLFIVHLNLDGKYREGDKRLLGTINGFTPPALALHKSFSQSADFIQKIRWYPKMEIGVLWLTDVLYVALRNCIYCSNAIKGIYKFGYRDALDAFDIAQADLPLMLALREGKYVYRQRTMNNQFTISIEDLQNVCGHITNAIVAFKRGGITNWTRDWDYDYWDERIIERAILNHEHNDLDFMTRLKQYNYYKIDLKRVAKSIVDQHAGVGPAFLSTSASIDRLK